MTSRSSQGEPGSGRLVLGILTLIAAAGLTIASLLAAQTREDVAALRCRIVELERRSPQIAEQLGGIRSELAAIQQSLTDIKQDLRELKKENKP
jgi:septal ring factor EnvC (AmiA/AmiB activator)